MQKRILSRRSQASWLILETPLLFRESLHDYLVRQGVIADDNYEIVDSESWDHVGVVKTNPRVVIRITDKMTTKEIKYHDARRNEVKRNNTRQRRKQPFPKIYANDKEDYELYEAYDDQIRAVMVDTGTNFYR